MTKNFPAWVGIGELRLKSQDGEIGPQKGVLEKGIKRTDQLLSRDEKGRCDLLERGKG